MSHGINRTSSKKHMAPLRAITAKDFHPLLLKSGKTSAHKTSTSIAKKSQAKKIKTVALFATDGGTRKPDEHARPYSPKEELKRWWKEGPGRKWDNWKQGIKDRIPWPQSWGKKEPDKSDKKNTNKRGFLPNSIPRLPSLRQFPSIMRPSDELINRAQKEGITKEILVDTAKEGAMKGLKAYGVYCGANAVAGSAVALAITAPAWAPPAAAVATAAVILGFLYKKPQSNDKNIA